MLSLLRQPYPLIETGSQKIFSSLLVGLFVYVFLRVFQPFGLYGFSSPDKEAIVAGYGVLTSVITLFHLYVLPLLFPRVFDERSWQVWHEITEVFLLLLTISIANSIYSIQAGLFPWHPQVFTSFIGITCMVGFFPVTGSIIAKQFWLMRRNLAHARTLQQVLEQNQATITQKEEATIPPSSGTVVFLAENGKDKLELAASSILYLASADNYVEIHWMEKDKPARRLFRSTLKQAEEVLTEYPAFFRCHRAYIINMDHVTGVEGNAQGYRLQLSGTDSRIPVSRSMNAILKSRLSGPC